MIIPIRKKLWTLRADRLTPLLLGALIVLSTTANTGNAAGSRPEVSWEEIAEALSVLPPAPKRPHRGYYTVPGKHKKESERRLEQLKAKGDIVPAILRSLERFKPGSDDGERNLLNLVTILKENPDERALAALDRIARLSPAVKFRAAWLDGAEQPVYGFSQTAQETAERIRIDMAAKEWGRALGGKSPAQRRDQLASFYWSPTTVDDHKRRGAGSILNTEFKPEERLDEIAKRLGTVIDAGTPWRHKIVVHMAEELRRLIEDGAPRDRALPLLDKIAAEAGNDQVRIYARHIRSRL